MTKRCRKRIEEEGKEEKKGEGSRQSGQSKGGGERPTMPSNEEKWGERLGWVMVVPPWLRPHAQTAKMKTSAVKGKREKKTCNI